MTGARDATNRGRRKGLAFSAQLPDVHAITAAIQDAFNELRRGLERARAPFLGAVWDAGVVRGRVWVDRAASAGECGSLLRDAWPGARVRVGRIH